MAIFLPRVILCISFFFKINGTSCFGVGVLNWVWGWGFLMWFGACSVGPSGCFSGSDPLYKHKRITLEKSH